MNLGIIQNLMCLQTANAMLRLLMTYACFVNRVKLKNECLCGYVPYLEGGIDQFKGTTIDCSHTDCRCVTCSNVLVKQHTFTEYSIA